MRKIGMSQIREIYYSLINRGVFFEERKGYHKRTIETGELLYINQHVVYVSKTRQKNLAMALNDNEKINDMVSQR